MIIQANTVDQWAKATATKTEELSSTPGPTG